MAMHAHQQCCIKWMHRGAESSPSIDFPVLHYLLKYNYMKHIRMTAGTYTFFICPPPQASSYMYMYMYIDTCTKHKVSVHDLLNYREASLPAHNHTYHSCTGTWKNYLNSYTQRTYHMWIIYKEQMSMTQKFLTPHLPRKVHWQAQSKIIQGRCGHANKTHEYKSSTLLREQT